MKNNHIKVGTKVVALKDISFTTEPCTPRGTVEVVTEETLAFFKRFVDGVTYARLDGEGHVSMDEIPLEMYWDARTMEYAFADSVKCHVPKTDKKELPYKSIF